MATTGVLCYMRGGGRVLLRLKAEGRFGGGLWNAPGGKLVDGESPAAAAAREVQEETGLAVRDLVDHGRLTFAFGDAAGAAYTVHVFSTDTYDGTPAPSEEGRLAWFSEAALPYERMWPDDPLWVPELLAGRRFEGWFRLSEDLRRLLAHEVHIDATDAP